MLNLVHRDLILSIKPKYADKIIAGLKTVELRRRFAREAVIGARVFIYSSSPAKVMVGYATISDVRYLPVRRIWELYGAEACITRAEFDKYFAGVEDGYAIALSKPRRLSKSATMESLKKRFGFRAPQSYRYAGLEYRALLG